MIIALKNLSRIKAIANNVRALGDLLLCFNAEEMDNEKLGALGIMIACKMDLIKVHENMLYEALVDNKLKPQEANSD